MFFLSCELFIYLSSFYFVSMATTIVKHFTQLHIIATFSRENFSHHSCLWVDFRCVVDNPSSMCLWWKLEHPEEIHTIMKELQTPCRRFTSNKDPTTAQLLQVLYVMTHPVSSVSYHIPSSKLSDIVTPVISTS